MRLYSFQKFNQKNKVYVQVVREVKAKVEGLIHKTQDQGLLHLKNFKHL